MPLDIQFQLNLFQIQFNQFQFVSIKIHTLIDQFISNSVKNLTHNLITGRDPVRPVIPLNLNSNSFVSSELIVTTTVCRWRRQRWIEDYWDGFDKALAVRTMVERGEKRSDTFETYWEEIFMKKNT